MSAVVDMWADQLNARVHQHCVALDLAQPDLDDATFRRTLDAIVEADPGVAALLRRINRAELRDA